MAKYKIVHYINQFFAGIGGEEKADYTPELREGVVGPGMGLKAALGEDYEIVSTIICGDNYFGENLDAATDTIIEMVKKCEPDVFVAGPAFNAGRYGVACGTICKAVEERLGIPVITGMCSFVPSELILSFLQSALILLLNNIQFQCVLYFYPCCGY